MIQLSLKTTISQHSAAAWGHTIEVRRQDCVTHPVQRHDCVDIGKGRVFDVAVLCQQRAPGPVLMESVFACLRAGAFGIHPRVRVDRDREGGGAEYAQGGRWANTQMHSPRGRAP